MARRFGPADAAAPASLADAERSFHREAEVEARLRVELQGRRGRSYVTLASAVTGPDGTYRVGYRFTHGAHGRYVFRLRVRHYPRFPYFLGYARAVNVFVR